MKRISILSIICFIWFSLTLNATSYFVKDDASGSADGSDWTNAFTDLHFAIETAVAGDSIFVAKGTYFSTDGDKTKSFVLKEGVKIFGSFHGDEFPVTALTLANRDYATDTTLLTADLNQDDLINSFDDNGYHVVKIISTEENPITEATVLDGFIIQGGIASSTTDEFDQAGGGLLLYAESGPCSPTLARLIIAANVAYLGGGIAIISHTSQVSQPKVDSCLFRWNAANAGAGLYISAGKKGISAGQINADFTIVDMNNNMLAGNYPAQGAAAYISTYGAGSSCQLNFTYCEISNHNADIGGAFYINAYEGIIDINYNSLNFSDNNNYAIYNKAAYGEINSRIDNCIIWHDTIINHGNVNSECIYSLIENSNGSGGTWNQNYGIDLGNNIDADPQWVDGSGRDFRLRTGSPALGVGNTEFGSNIGTYQGVGFDGSAPIITIDQDLTDFGVVQVGQVSDEQMFTVSGTDLTDDLTILASNGFELSLVSGTGFGAFVYIPQSGGTIAETTVYVRFEPGAEQQYIGTLSHSSNGAKSKFIQVRGQGHEAAFIKLIGYLDDFGTVEVGDSSAEQSIIIEGYALTDDISITAPDDFQVTLTQGDYSGVTNSVTLSQSGGSVNATEVYVRFLPTENKHYYDTIIVTSTSAIPKIIAGVGRGYIPPSLNINSTMEYFGDHFLADTSDEQSYTVSGTNLIDNLFITPSDSQYQISLSSAIEFVSQDTVTLTPINGTLAETTIYVHFIPSVVGTTRATIEHFTDNLVTETIDVSGAGKTDPNISINKESLATCLGDALDTIILSLESRAVENLTIETEISNATLIEEVSIAETGTEREVITTTAESETGSGSVTIRVISEVPDTAEATYEVEVFELPVINNVEVVREGTAETATVTISTEQAGTDYEYSIGGTAQSSNEFSGVTAGNYNAQVASNEGCNSELYPFTVEFEPDYLLELSQSGIEIYPNPAQKYFNIVLPEGIEKNVKIKITDLSGKLIISRKIYQKRTQIDINSLYKGNYILLIQSGDNNYQGKLIVK